MNLLPTLFRVEIGCFSFINFAYTQYDRELLEPDIYIEKPANQALSSGNTGLQRRVARMGHD